MEACDDGIRNRSNPDASLVNYEYDAHHQSSAGRSQVGRLGLSQELAPSRSQQFARGAAAHQNVIHPGGPESAIDPETMFQGNLLPSNYFAKTKANQVVT